MFLKFTDVEYKRSKLMCPSFGEEMDEVWVVTEFWA